MKNLISFSFLLLFSLLVLPLSGQPGPTDAFKLAGTNPVELKIDQLFTENGEISPPGLNARKIFGMALTGEVIFEDETAIVRAVLVDNNFREFLIFEWYPLIADTEKMSLTEVCEETAILDGIIPAYLRIEVKNATLRMKKLTLAGALPPGLEIARISREKHLARNEFKISKLNQNLQKKGAAWVAGHTEVSNMSYSERKNLYGNSTFPAGFEYYTGGIIQTGPGLKAASASLMVEKWDWRNRHGKNWISPVKNQSSCGSCWAFAATGATEAQVNLYFNQLLNLDLSEQDVLSCSGAGTCNGGQPGTALSYIASTGIVDEAAFPYTATDQPCANKSSNPAQLIKIAGKVDFGSTTWPREEDALKKMIIKYGPISGGIYDWSHAMTLVGWLVVKEGDRFYTRDLNKSTYWITVPAGSPLIGTTVWMFKNSWGIWGDAGYVYIQTSMSNVGWTHAVLNPVHSLKQTCSVLYADADGDGYYWWGLGTKPASCPGPSTPDGNDADNTLGPLDAYGNCMVLGSSPVANFEANKTSLDAGGQVTFTDLSTNAPTSWSWSFPGGNPVTSTSQNPVITYPSAGTYDVTLAVTNNNGSSSVTRSAYIVVNPYIPSYCSSYGNATREWIASVTLNGKTKTSSSGSTIGYQDFTPTIFAGNSSASNTITLVPGFGSKASSECFAVWIDYNRDFDFNDPGEQVVTASRIKSTITRNFTVPSNALQGLTRMRVSMKRNSLPTACEIIATGEVEDYSIQIGAASAKNASIEVAEEYLSGEIRVYPNPAHEKLTIDVSRIYPGNRLTIYSVQGAIISVQTLRDPVTTLELRGFHPGAYILQITNGGHTFREKFIKY